MTTVDKQNGFLHQLRELQANGSTAELLALINKLKAIGYPKSILNLFEPSSSPGIFTHPYSYDWRDPVRKIGLIARSPLVSIIIVVYHSGKDLSHLLRTLAVQSYRNLELIVVNNGGEDIGPCLESWNGNYKYLQAPNPGFAEGNNIGLEEASGDVLLLLNPDTELEKETIKELVHAIELDATAAATIPLIYFSKPFYKLFFTTKNQTSFAIDIRSLLASLDYRKYFVCDGELGDDGLVYSNQDNQISLDIALNPECDWVEVDVISMISPDQELCLQIVFDGSGEKAKLFYLDNQRQTVRLSISSRVHSSSRYLINNAGSGIRPDSDQPFDIGFGEVDTGQYSSRAYREAFCGCCVLLRRDLFISRKIFISEFFAYYEDSELSYWLQINRMNILYVPSAIVYHRHSESTVEQSPLWKKLVTRSAGIYHAIRRGEPVRIGETLPRSEYSEISASQELIKTLTVYDASLSGKTIQELVSRTRRTTVGIYNSYWDSLGGGERHALDVAEIALQCQCEVYLLSENYFSLDRLRQFFQIDLAGIKVLVPGEVTETLTQRFDIFINSTFCSTLVSFATTSYYIVSFPHKGVNQEFISSYKFLYNSDYTRRWAQRYWGYQKGKTLLPILSFQAQARSINIDECTTHLAKAKDRIILSVGRFNYDGHCKNQHMIATIYARLWKSGAIGENWQLVLAGSVDPSMDASLSHYKDTEKILAGCNASLIANAKREAIENLYQSASIYLHAAGLGVNPIKAPEKNEHFGIAPFEALLQGCLLIAFHQGGPAVMIDNSQRGLLYRNEDELVQRLLQAVSSFERESLDNRQYRIKLSLEYSLALVEQSRFAAVSLFPAPLTP